MSPTPCTTRDGLRGSPLPLPAYARAVRTTVFAHDHYSLKLTEPAHGSVHAWKASSRRWLQHLVAPTLLPRGCTEAGGRRLRCCAQAGWWWSQSINAPPGHKHLWTLHLWAPTTHLLLLCCSGVAWDQPVSRSFPSPQRTLLLGRGHLILSNLHVHACPGRCYCYDTAGITSTLTACEWLLGSLLRRGLRELGPRSLGGQLSGAMDGMGGALEDVWCVLGSGAIPCERWEPGGRANWPCGDQPGARFCWGMHKHARSKRGEAFTATMHGVRRLYAHFFQLTVVMAPAASQWPGWAAVRGGTCVAVVVVVRWCIPLTGRITTTPVPRSHVWKGGGGGAIKLDAHLVCARCTWQMDGSSGGSGRPVAAALCRPVFGVPCRGRNGLFFDALHFASEVFWPATHLFVARRCTPPSAHVARRRASVPLLSCW